MPQNEILIMNNDSDAIISKRIKNRTLAIRFGAKVEQAKDGRFNYFSHPDNCAFGSSLQQSEGDFETRSMAWEMAGAVIEAKFINTRPVSWL